MPKTTIIWSSEALDRLDDIFEYIYEEWGIATVLDFQNELNRLLYALTKNKKLCPTSKIVNLRKCVLSKQTSLVYRFSSSTLEIITLIDNRSDHSY